MSEQFWLKDSTANVIDWASYIAIAAALIAVLAWETGPWEFLYPVPFILLTLLSAGLHTEREKRGQP